MIEETGKIKKTKKYDIWPSFSWIAIAAMVIAGMHYGYSCPGACRPPKTVEQSTP